MEKVIIVSQTCPKCYSLINNIYQKQLFETLMKHNISLVYYNKYLLNGPLLMRPAIEFMENLDKDRYKGIPHVTPVMIEHDEAYINFRVLAVGENAIFEYLHTLQ